MIRRGLDNVHLMVTSKKSPVLKTVEGLMCFTFNPCLSICCVHYYVLYLITLNFNKNIINVCDNFVNAVIKILWTVTGQG